MRGLRRAWSRWPVWRRAAIIVLLTVALLAAFLAFARADESWRSSMGGLDFRLALIEEKVTTIESREIWILIALVSNILAVFVAVGKAALRRGLE